MPSSIADQNILVLNWRDVGHPEAGGSEAYCWETATRLVRQGAQVTLFTAHHAGAEAEDVREGVHVVRAGTRFGVYPAAARFLRRHRNAYTAVLDFQNGIPFFAPLFTARDCAVVCVIHHVHQQQFGMHFSPAVARVGRFLERDASRVVYGLRPVVAVSPSTRRDVRLALGLRGPIHIVPNGVRALPESPVTRSASPSIAVVTRLVAHKRLDLFVEAVPGLLARWPSLTVDIAGTGKDLQALTELVYQLGLAGTVRLHGYVSEQRKSELLRRAWLTVSPSANEGWGLTVIEANSVGTPAVVFDVPGLQDSVIDGETGWLLAPDSSLEAGIARALHELQAEPTRQAYAQRCAVWAGGFDWDASAQRLAAVILTEVDRRQRTRPTARATSDLSVVLEGRPSAGEPLSSLLARLRRTDRVSQDRGKFRLILHGCDEEEAMRAASRLGLNVLLLGLASHEDLLWTGPRGRRADGNTDVPAD